MSSARTVLVTISVVCNSVLLTIRVEQMYVHTAYFNNGVVLRVLKDFIDIPDKIEVAPLSKIRKYKELQLL